MTKHTLVFTLSGYWQIGSGAGEQAIADSVVLRDSDGLPTIPGRAIKGLLRDAMELLALCEQVPKSRVEALFGSSLPGSEDPDDTECALEQARFQTKEAALWFGSAGLPQAWRQWVRTRPESEVDPVRKELYGYLAATAIDARGVVKEHSLRVSEVAMPVELRSEVHGPDNDPWADDLKRCLPLIRALGKRRSRGFGRVDIRLEAK